MSSTDKPARPKTLSVWVIVLAEIAWAFAALIFFLLFSVAPPDQPRPDWYSAGTSVFELVPNIVAAWLCLRNWRSPQIVSGRSVWLGIGLGAFSYFIGNLLFTYWEVVLGLEPAVSPGDAFFILAYIFYIVGMSSAVRSRRLNLEVWQWGVVSVIAVAGVALAIGVSSASKTDAPTSQPWRLDAPAYAQVSAPSGTKAPAAKPSTPLKAPAIGAPVSPTPSIPAASPSSPTPTAPAASPLPTSSAQPEAQKAVPEWALQLEQLLAPFERPVTLFYLVCDVILLVLAATLLLAFWGGRFSQSWRMIAAAAFSLYIADMWFKYASATQADYQSGSLPEVFWVFSTVLFGIGAALEFDLSSRSRRSGSRRRS